MRAWTALLKCSGSRKSVTRLCARLLRKMAPSSACSASRLLGGSRIASALTSRSGVTREAAVDSTLGAFRRTAAFEEVEIGRHDDKSAFANFDRLEVARIDQLVNGSPTEAANPREVPDRRGDHAGDIGIAARAATGLRQNGHSHHRGTMRPLLLVLARCRHQWSRT